MSAVDKAEVQAIDKRHYMPVFSRYDVVLSHGDGPYVFDTEGKKYLDFLAGIAVNVLGHAHPALVAAITTQAGKLIHCTNLYYTEEQAKLVQTLAQLSGLDKVFLANSGAEANEGAIKLARKYAKQLNADRVEIITAENSFHGRTLATLTATAQPKYQHGYEPLPPGFKYVPYNDLAALKRAMSDKTCAVMVEPIQGEGGINIPDDGYLQGVRELCDACGALLIFDEIQTGMGRTGKMFAYQHTDVKPDILTIAKGLGGGVPIGAILATDKVASAFGPGDHGSTFGGNPLACAAANAVLAVITAEDLPGNAERIGRYMLGELAKLQAKYPTVIKEVRGKGLMIGVKLNQPGREIVNRCLEHGALINCTAGDVLRFVPPLIINEKHVDEMIGILDKVIDNL
ncbi:acetylornithine and succinylornithine aminotransferases [Thermosinus carboxydivorans Nor1]|uniref:Acetylornithine aminotransferase n=1 Tax=Thermosinus carboxydivorans Nor1 TaxID=401526 RepID=A1HQQ7_9FIRM|nr:acetylornithine and succinylornithine aminotransferases [Thermosinus carboxydivorans Nor1]